MSEAPKKRGGCLKILFGVFVFGLSIAAIVAIVSAAGAYIAYDNIYRTAKSGGEATIEIPSGSTGDDIAELLADAALVDQPVFFKVALRLEGEGRVIKAGTYTLPLGVSATQLLDVLFEGPIDTFDPSQVPPERRVTVPEGLSIGQMANLLEGKEGFVEVARDPELIAELGVPADTLEGYLMPNTYFFKEVPTGEDIALRMIEQFKQEIAELEKDYPDLVARDLHRLLTVASLVEEEAAVAEERPLVAAVIYNRLELGMALELDCTLQYALQKYGQRMLNEDKEVSSPYNTYRNAGLPPGPISNPGAESIRAAIEPAEVDYLYFVSNADGKTHTFSSTLSEHNRAVQRYRREIAEQRRNRRQAAND